MRVNPVRAQLEKIRSHCQDVRRTYRLTGSGAEQILTPLVNPKDQMVGFQCTVTSQKFWLGLPAIRKSEWSQWFGQDESRHAELARILSIGSELTP